MELILGNFITKQKTLNSLVRSGESKTEFTQFHLQSINFQLLQALRMESKGKTNTDMLKQFVYLSECFIHILAIGVEWDLLHEKYYSTSIFSLGQLRKEEMHFSQSIINLSCDLYKTRRKEMREYDILLRKSSFTDIVQRFFGICSFTGYNPKMLLEASENRIKEQITVLESIMKGDREDEHGQNYSLAKAAR